jgi:hypothetical protein
MRWSLLFTPLLAAGCVAPVHMILELACDPDDVANWPPLDADVVSPVGALAPFDLELDDYAGPASSTYGKSPEIVAVPNNFGIDVLLQDYGAGAPAKLVRIERDQERFAVTQILDVDGLDRVMGLAVDDEGYRYVATGVAEDVSHDETPAVGEYRDDIVHIDKIDREGEVLYTVDLDRAREATGNAPELVMSPMIAASSRLAWGGGKVEIVHGINTDWDDSIGQRHQKALSTVIDAATGDVTRTASIWVSHSFDQRLYYDGAGFIEMHLGDAYPRQIVMARVEPDSASYPIMYNKGTTGDNNTYSRLGGLALVPPEDDPDFGYLAVFSTESTTELSGGGPKNVGLVRVRRDFETTDPASGEHIDADMPDELVSAVDGTNYTNHLKWLTDYTTESGLQAERTRIVSVGCGRYVVLWEEWDLESTFYGTQGVVLDAQGDVLVEAREVTPLHIPRGDDPFEFDNSAAWISADKETGALHVNRVHADLSFTQDTIE